MSKPRSNRTTCHSRVARAVACCLAAVAFSSCDELFDEAVDRCGAKAHPHVFAARDLPQALGSPYLHTAVAGGKRAFTWIVVVENACTHEHVQAQWILTMDTGPLPAGWQVDAGWATSSAHGDDVVLTRNAGPGLTQYSGTADIGLKQVWGEGPGRFALSLSVSFNSKGNETVDRQVLHEAFLNNASFILDMLADRKDYKAP